MYQLWNNQCQSSFLAIYKSDLLHKQNILIQELVDQIKQQLSKMTSLNEQCPTVSTTDTETQKLQDQNPTSPPQAKPIEKKSCSKKRRKNKQRCYIEGRWTLREHNLYLSFLEQNSEYLWSSKNLKIQQKVFKQMSELIRSRTAAQCRSHHKKFDFRSFLKKMKSRADQSDQ